MRDAQPDVRRQGERGRPAARSSRFRGSPTSTAINAHARVQLKQVEVAGGDAAGGGPRPSLHLRLRHLRQRGHAAPRSAPCSCRRRARAAADQLWTTATPISVTIPSAHVGVRIRLVGGTDANAACGALYTECYDTDSPTASSTSAVGAPATAPAARNAWLLPGSCAARRLLRDRPTAAPGFRPRSTSARCIRSPAPSVTADVWASVDGAGHYSLTPGGTSGLVTWTAHERPADRRSSGPHTVELNWNWEQTTGTWNGKTCTDKKNNPCKAEGTFGPVQRAFIAGGRSGPLRSVQVFESGVTTSGSNSFQTGTAPHARRHPRRHRQPQGAVARDRPDRRAPRHGQPEPVDRLRSRDLEPAGTRSTRAAGRRTRSTRRSPAPPTTSSGRCRSPGSA